MNQKIGRNDPCSCGSGKKFKQCCLSKLEQPKARAKLTAKWINAPIGPDLMSRTFGNIIESQNKFSQVKEIQSEEIKEEGNV